MARDTRLFARIDLDYADHPKIVDLSDAAFRAHITMILYARKYETDGLIKNRVANRIASQWDTDVLAELQGNDPERPSLLRLPTGDYELTGYADMQETKAEISARKQRNRANGSKGGRPRKTQPVSESDSEPGAGSGTQKKAETETESETVRQRSNDRSARARRGTRIDPDWTPKQATIDTIRAECPGVDVQAEHRVFLDYWVAQPGQKGVKTDWDATWRNWMRRAATGSRQHPAPRPGGRAEAARSFVERLEVIEDETRGSRQALDDDRGVRQSATG